MDLSPTLIETLITLAIGGVCFWLWWLKGEIKEVEKETAKEVQLVKDAYRELQLDLAKNYHGKEEIKDMLDKSLEPIHEVLKELKDEVKALRREPGRRSGDQS